MGASDLYLVVQLKGHFALLDEEYVVRIVTHIVNYISRFIRSTAYVLAYVYNSR